MSAITDTIPQPPPTTSTRTAAPPLLSNTTASPAPPATRLFELQREGDQPSSELIQHRFLSRQGSLLLVGNTGIGKSSLTMQLMIHWALGRGCFNILPTGPLKSLLIQGENDVEDLIEMRDGVVASMELSDEERASINSNIAVCHESGRDGSRFIEEVLAPLLQQHRPDLVWLDPVFQYLGGDSSQQEVVSGFLRQELGPLLTRHDSAVVLVHHTNKPSKASHRPSSNPNLWAYDAAGSAEFANWPRAILSLQATHQPAIYKLVAAKRGKRLGWLKPDGITPSFEKLLRHARQPGMICWDEMESATPLPTVPQLAPDHAAVDVQQQADEVEQAILATVPMEGSVEKKGLIEQLNQVHSWGKNRLTSTLNELINHGQLTQCDVPRPGKRAAVHVRRPPLPLLPTPLLQPPAA